MSILSQLSMSGGEIGPAFYPRTDLEKFAKGLRRCRNFFIAKHGGAYNRPGSRFHAVCGDLNNPVRPVPFRTIDGRSYILEFGNYYFRIFDENGDQVLEDTKTITGVSQAAHAVVSITSHGYAPEDEIFTDGIVGMTELNGRHFRVTDVTANSFKLNYLNGDPVDSTGFTAYSSAGTAARVYQVGGRYPISSPENVEDISNASQAVVTITGHSFVDDQVVYINEVGGMTQVNNRFFIVANAGANDFKIKDYDTGAYVDSQAYGTYTSGGKVYQSEFQSASPGYTTDHLPDVQFYASGLFLIMVHPEFPTHTLLADSFDPTLWSLFEGIGAGLEIESPVVSVSGGNSGTGYYWAVTAVNGSEVESAVESEAGSVVSRQNAPSSGTPITLEWTPSDDHVWFNIYARTHEDRPWEYVTTVYGDTFVDDASIVSDPTRHPPTIRVLHNADDEDYVGAITGYQNRTILGASSLFPEIIDASRASSVGDFTVNAPLKADDAIRFKLLGLRVKFMLDVGKLVLFTPNKEVAIMGNEAGILLPGAINPDTVSEWGIGDVPPVRVGDSAIFVQEDGKTVRDLVNKMESSGYSGNDLTYFAYHLFETQGLSIQAMAFQKTPNSILWCVMSDGTVRSLTYIRETNIFAWARHDMESANVEGICIMPGADHDDVYVTVHREIDGDDYRYLERLDTRTVGDVRDCVFMDSALTYDGRNLSISHTMTLSGGTDWEDDETLTLTSSTAYFTAGDVGNSVQLYLEDEETGDVEYIRLTITAFTSNLIVSVQANRTVPVGLRAVATNAWALAADQITGLWHLEGQAVAVLGDGYVVASPNNAEYDVITVTDGTIQLDDTYGVIHVGLPITADIETLDIDTIDGKLVNQNKLVNRLYVHVEKTRGLWAGPKPPSDDSDDPLEGLEQLRPREVEANPDEPPTLQTGVVDIPLLSEWTSNGRVFIRQVDPLPATILALKPEGAFGFTSKKGA